MSIEEHDAFVRESEKVLKDIPPTEEPKFCCRCKEEFPVQQNDSKYRGWSMGKLRPLKYAPLKIRREFREWLDSEIHREGYLCGNCFFDLTE